MWHVWRQGFQPPTRRRCFATPNKPIPGSISKRKLDIGIIYGGRNEMSNGGAPCDWCDVLVPGELKSNPREDNHSSTWFDLSRYAREIFAAQDTRRSVTGFTLCGSVMRLWTFDRLGAVASHSFDILGISVDGPKGPRVRPYHLRGKWQQVHRNHAECTTGTISSR
ncbi:uncharacterized protein BDZ99DRAFT_242542 [Mytilinidion resinicola]|uniref:Fungal-type protein kinase domain-containing protein n=1 Tax=Mytilinidion resinicola TaxID=574789 RepID=A0A6A6YXZ6_9PEZI|nr:uncharacterized protein BDZ99DRAFT_242542 [Mytilinidion resinicola]KAF2812795.1 hypothetical protein BDZ99DRAFT_242542 [Mytilinidion resinicola]